MAGVLRFAFWLALNISFFGKICTDDHDHVENFHKFATELTAVSAPALDALEHLKLITSKSASLLKLAGPMGSFIAQIIEFNYKPKSEELEAIEDLKQTFNQRLDNIQELSVLILNAVTLNVALSDYEDRVTIPIATANYFLTNALTRRTPSAAKRLQEYCHNDASFDMLIYIERITYADCPKPTNEELRVNELAIHTFLEIEDNPQFRHRNLRDDITYTSKKLNLIEAVSKMNESQAELALRSIHRYYIPERSSGFLYRRDKEFVEQELLKGFSFSFRCIMKTVMERTEFKKEAILSLIQMIGDDLQIGLLRMYCAEFIAPLELNALAEETSGFIEKITSYMAHYVSNRLENFWPEIAKDFAKKIVDEQGEIRGNEESYTSLANKIQADLNSRGNTNYTHQVLVTDHSLFHIYLSLWPVVGNKNKNFIFISNHKGVDVVISRHTRFYQDISFKAERIVLDKRGSLELALRKRKSSANEIMDEVLKILRGKMLFGTAALIRRSSYCSASAGIVAGVAQSEKMFGAAAYYSFNGKIDCSIPMTVINEKIMLYLFL